MQPSDEIKSKLDIIDLIRDYIPLKPAGVNFRALCPFHHEKSPSFTVSPEKQIWHCFGCGKGGDIFSFVMEMEGLSFIDALRNLATKAGVVLKKENARLSSQRNRLLDIIEFATKYYHKMLLEGKEAESIRKYLAARGLKEEMIESWKIGYSPDSWDDLINLLKNKGYQDNEIFLAGMAVKKEGTSRFYNRFRGRVMFPISDINGNVVAFSARVNPEKEKEEKMGKYINGPQTLIYDKSKILFGLDKAKQEIKKQDLAIIAEGQMDAITAHQEGYTNVVASSGTALSIEQVILLKRYTNNIAFALDADSAGQLATSRGDDLIKNHRVSEEEAEDSKGNKKIFLVPGISHGMYETLITIPKGKDPDECIRNSPGEWDEAVEKRKPLMQHFFDIILPKFNLDDIADRRQVAKELLPKIVKLTDKIEQNFWLKKLSQSIDTKEEILFEALNKILSSAPVSTKSDNEAENSKIIISRAEMLSELLLALILKFSQLIEYAINHIRPDYIVGEGVKSLYSQLIIYYNNIIDNWTQEGGESNQPQISYRGFKKWLSDSEKLGQGPEIDGDKKENKESENQLLLLDKLVIFGDKDFYDYEVNQAKNEIIKVITSLKKYYLGERREEIKKLIAQAEIQGDESHLKSLLEEFKVLSDEIMGLEIED
jgi:DNA primase